MLIVNGRTPKKSLLATWSWVVGKGESLFFAGNDFQFCCRLVLCFFLIFGVLCLFMLVSFRLSVLELLFLTQQLRYCLCFAFLAWLQLFLYLDNRFFSVKISKGWTSVLHHAEPWISAELLDNSPFKSGFSKLRHRHVTHVCFTLRETWRK